MKKIFFTLVLILTTTFGAGMLSPATASAADCDGTFLTFRPWYYGLTDGSASCNLKTDFDTKEKFTSFVWAIVLNVLGDIFSAVGYLAIGFLIYGGYMYVLSRGDPGRIAKGKKTVIAAIAGLVICILASLIVNTIVDILTGAIGA